jgi:hypothetical protein
MNFWTVVVYLSIILCGMAARDRKQAFIFCTNIADKPLLPGCDLSSHCCFNCWLNFKLKIKRIIKCINVHKFENKFSVQISHFLPLCWDCGAVLERQKSIFFLSVSIFIFSKLGRAMLKFLYKIFVLGLTSLKFIKYKRKLGVELCSRQSLFLRFC